ncbi:hypothetical protein RFI_01980 [Reticulomyxa filosa]|uniref:ubiquitinyl hydrolase 1 n=1 Tax=Reticulomyxa filosa TaxID=46433 RepID=X6P984_RETFI|nr:hypothetical protein RFI_01980 [Reticulomyxa filosa]|eukprot:ETO35095.1 hypothetical protein RFI_01980 [Reticulomyxa filosa]
MKNLYVCMCVCKKKKKRIKDVRTQETSIVHKVWGGYLRSQVKCDHCGKESNTYDSILDLSLEIKGTSVMTALKHFTAKELLHGNNRYRCGKCRSLQKATKQLSIFEPPNVLVLHLKRFAYQQRHSLGRGYGLFGFGGKINKHIAFEQELDITSFMSYSTCPKVSYRLIGVVVHHGHTANSGHYIAYIHSMDDRWYCMDDSRVIPVNLQTVLAQNAYLLFYLRNEPKIPYQSPLLSSRTESIDMTDIQWDVKVHKQPVSSNNNKHIKLKNEETPQNLNLLPTLQVLYIYLFSFFIIIITCTHAYTHIISIFNIYVYVYNIYKKKKKGRKRPRSEKEGSSLVMCPNDTKKRRVVVEERDNSAEELLRRFLEDENDGQEESCNDIWSPYTRTDSIISMLSDSSSALPLSLPLDKQQYNNGDGTDSCTTTESQEQHHHPPKTPLSTNGKTKYRNALQSCNASVQEVEAYLNANHNHNNSNGHSNGGTVNGTDTKSTKNGWGINTHLDKRVQESHQQFQEQLKEKHEEFIPEKSEWDQLLDTGAVIGKKQGSKKKRTEKWDQISAQKQLPHSNPFQSRQSGEINQEIPMRTAINKETGEKKKLHFKRYTTKNTTKRYRNYRYEKRTDL